MEKMKSQENITHNIDGWTRMAIAFEGKIAQYRKDIKKLQEAVKVAKERSAQGVEFPGRVNGD